MLSSIIHSETLVIVCTTANVITSLTFSIIQHQTLSPPVKSGEQDFWGKV